MNDTIQYDTTATMYMGKGYREQNELGQFVPEQKTDFVFTTTSVEGDFYTALITEFALISFTIINFVLLIVIWRKLKRIEKKLQ